MGEGGRQVCEIALKCLKSIINSQRSLDQSMFFDMLVRVITGLLRVRSVLRKELHARSGRTWVDFTGRPRVVRMVSLFVDFECD